MAKKKTPKVKEQEVTKNTETNNDDVMYKLLDSKVEIPLGLLRQKHIFIATPCYGGQIGEPYFRSMMRLAILCNKYNIQYTISTLANESLVTRGRNTLNSFFMENKAATHLFFIDADIEFNPEDILRMVAYDKDIVVGAYPKKAMNWSSIISAARADESETEETIEGHSSNYVVNFDFLKDENGNHTPQVQIEDNLVKLKDAGTGFMCIKKEVIQKMFDKHPEMKYVNDINVDQKFEPFMYALFDTIIDPDSRRYLSEDYMFCRTWQNMGGTVYLDPRTALNHVGHYTFRGNIRKLFTGENKHSRKQEVSQNGKTTT
ncbi:hypothetical protein N9C44_00305 [bacterium]|nr:hypothetical protein [bacterium]|tara:strand:- start:1843 stop:2793 length:951 start_codon:yes stop_codon:yes gene_type:complete